jgi:hypothetical protein
MASKKVKPGSGNSTSAKFEKPTRLSKTTKSNEMVRKALEGQKKTEDVARVAKRRGYLTQNEAMILQSRVKTRKPAI